MNDASTLTRSAFQSHFEALLGQPAKDGLIDYAVINIPSDSKPWMDTGIDLSAGE